MTAPAATIPPLVALAGAIDLLNDESVRYTQRFDACPNGCRWGYVREGLFDGKPVTLPQPMSLQIAGPTDCGLCDEGTVEDENGPSLDPIVESLQALLTHLQSLDPDRPATL